MKKEMIKRILQLIGLEIKLIKNGGGIQGHLKAVLEKYRIDLVIDVGANRGQFSQMLRDTGYKGDILSFEPVSSSFEILNRISKKDSKWKSIKLGLGDKTEQNNINVFDSTHFSSLLNPSNFGKEVFRQIESSRQEIIQIDTLDNILLQEGLLGNRRIFLKMDTQGYDLNVFKGAKKSLNNIVGLLSEISFIPIYNNMPPYRQALEEFERNDFAVSGLFPVVRNTDLSIIEMDCVMVKRSAL
jgi:FkbM family methyltransferase